MRRIRIRFGSLPWCRRRCCRSLLIISKSINLFTFPVGLNGFPRPAGQPLAPADGRIANSMLMAVIMVLLLQRHLVRGIALTSFGGR